MSVKQRGNELLISICCAVKLWDILEEEGKTLAALNASLFAADLSDQVGRRILAARDASLARKLVRTYCVAKGIAVAFNPIPVADLFAAAIIDVGMVVHLSKVYGLPLNRSGSRLNHQGHHGRVSSADGDGLGAAFCVQRTQGRHHRFVDNLNGRYAQGAIAYYSTYLVGQAAAKYLAKGKSWGEGGPKLVVKQILDSIDRDSVLRDAKREIQARLKLSN